VITASLLYNHLMCPHRVSMDAFANPDTRDPASPFLQMLWKRGSLFEDETVAGLQHSFTDLSAFKGAEKEQCTREALARGDALIYSGRLTFQELLGEPDVLRREGAGYVAIDIKSGSGEEGGEDEDGKPKKTYGVQIALYTDILIRLGLSAGRYGYIWDVHGEEKRYELDTPLGPKSPCLWEVYLETRGMVERTLAHAASRPAAAAVCKQCVWRSACLRELKACSDLTLLPELGRAKRDALLGQFPTLEDLAHGTIERVDFNNLCPIFQQFMSKGGPCQQFACRASTSIQRLRQ
jgi:predicted RecB family nuclease